MHSPKKPWQGRRPLPYLPHSAKGFLFMNFVSCFNPRIIKNIYTDEKVQISCGKCPACRNVKRMQLVKRIQFESTLHRYSYFFTLTYSNEHLPTAQVEFDDDLVPIAINITHNNYDEYYDISPSAANELGLSEVFAKTGTKLRVPYNKKSDIQKFFKRLRITLQRKLPALSQSEVQIRYFIVSEMGGKHLRPHYHGILWFDSERVDSILQQVFHSCWPFGRVDLQLSRDAASGYVAKYINSTCLYPNLYTIGSFKPFRLSSRRPAVGVPFKYSEALREKILSGNCEYIVRKSEKLSIDTVPRAYSDRFFPKCRRFNEFSFNDKLRSYSLSLKVDKSSLELPEQDGLLRDWYISNRVLYLSTFFRIPFVQYVQSICKFYDNLSLKLLKQFYEFQEEFSRLHPTETLRLLTLYPVRCAEILERMRNNNLVDYDFKVLNSFDSRVKLIDEQPFYDAFNVEDFNPLTFQEVKEFYSDNLRYERDSVKTKIINEEFFEL